MTSAQLIRELANKDWIDPETAAQVLGLPILAIDRVTIYRCEYQLGSNELFADATAIVGSRDSHWSIIDLVPRDLELDALGLPPHQQRPLIKHTSEGAELVGIEHHVKVRAGELVVVTAGTSERIERVTLMAR
jgi:hypothetical protein